MDGVPAAVAVVDGGMRVRGGQRALERHRPRRRARTGARSSTRPTATWCPPGPAPRGRGARAHARRRGALVLARRPGGGGLDGGAVVLTDIDAARAAEGERAALRRIADGISREDDPGALFAQVAEEAGTLLSADGAGVVRFDDEARTAVMLGRLGGRSGAAPRRAPGALPLEGEGATARVYATGLPGAAPPTRPEARRSPGARRWSCPIRRRRAAVGRARRREPATGTRLTEDAEERLSRFAELVGLAVANADARERLAAPGAHRPPHRAAAPRHLPPPARRGDRPHRPLRQRAEPRRDRHRPLQDRQRRPRPRGGRRHPARRRRAPVRARARGRPGGARRRRGVRLAHARDARSRAPAPRPSGSARRSPARASARCRASRSRWASRSSRDSTRTGPRCSGARMPRSSRRKRPAGTARWRPNPRSLPSVWPSPGATRRSASTRCATTSRSWRRWSWRRSSGPSPAGRSPTRRSPRSSRTPTARSTCAARPSRSASSELHRNWSAFAADLRLLHVGLIAAVALERVGNLAVQIARLAGLGAHRPRRRCRAVRGLVARMGERAVDALARVGAGDRPRRHRRRASGRCGRRAR